MKLLLYKGRGIVSRLIQWQTRGTFSHASILFTEDDMVYEAWQGKGVIKHKLNRQDLEGIKAFSYKDPLSLAIKDTAREFLEAQLGKPYDWKGVIRFVSRKRHAINDEWFCSELATEVFSLINCPLFRFTQSYEVSPDLMKRSLELLPCNI
jgi:uncharacterized protein YycO